MLRFIFVIFLLAACAHHEVAEDVPPPHEVEATPTPAPKPKIKYVYVQTPETVSAMTLPSFEHEPGPPLGQQIVKFLWPLLAMLGAGALMIAGLYIENAIITRQLERRRARQSA